MTVPQTYLSKGNHELVFNSFIMANKSIHFERAVKSEMYNYETQETFHDS